MKILNQPTPPAFRESVKVGEQNLYTRAKELVGDRDPREHEFSDSDARDGRRQVGRRPRAAGARCALRRAVGPKYAWRDDRRRAR